MFSNDSRTLSISKPFPSVTSFTVTNEPPHTRWRQVAFYLTLIIRVVLTMTAVCLVQLKFRPRQMYLYDSPITVLFHPAFDQLSVITGWLSVQGTVCLALSILGLSLFGLCDYKEETLVVITYAGVGVSTARTGWWGSAEDSRRLVMLPQMEDMLIHEGYVGSKAKLAIAVSGEDDMLVVFPVSLPCVRFGYSSQVEPGE